MSNISKYLKMNSAELEKEIQRQSKKIAACKETMALLRKLQVADKAAQQDVKQRNNTKRSPEESTGDMSWVQ